MITPQIKTPAVSKDEAVARLWKLGNLSWMLDKSQKELYDNFHNSKHKIQTWMLPRRFGKTRTLCVIAIEQCIKYPGSIIKYLSPTKTMVERNIRPIIREILLSCPSDITPELKKADGIYYFANGSEIQMAGSEGGNIEGLRGGFSHISIIDEAQDVAELNHAIKSVLLPTTLTTKGKIILAGTPPQDTDHEFLHYVEKAEIDGILIKRTIYDNPRLTKEDIDDQIREYGGQDNEEFRREYLCERIKSKTLSVIPEFDDNKEKEIVRDWVKPPHYHAYTSMDVGGRDWTVVLYAYYDFRADKIIVEDETVMSGNEMHIPVLTQQIKDKENLLWTNPLTQEFKKPKKRVSDHNLIVINDIKKFSNYTIFFETADKREKMAGLNFLRVLINTNKIIIHPRCTTLIRHLKNCKWSGNKALDKFATCPLGSHYDAVDAAVYLVKAIDFKLNPYPNDFQSPLRSEDVFKQESFYKKATPKEDVYLKIMNVRNKDNDVVTGGTEYLKYLNVQPSKRK